MIARWIFRVAAVATTCVAGCLNPNTTRLPDLYTRDPRLEIRSLARHDPFPDKDLGPDTFVRPRGFVTERTMPRRNYEERILQGAQPEFAPPISPLPPTGWRYPESVQ